MNLEKMKMDKHTTPYEHKDSQHISKREQILMQNYILQEKIASLTGHNVPDRIVNAKGSGAYGKFTVTNDLSTISKAQLFSKVGNSCKVFVRFSTVNGEKGSADTIRDSRGFAVKFYTEEGNWDLIGSSFPTFFIKDSKKFPQLLLAQKRDAKTNLKTNLKLWEFFSQNPESLHTVLMLFSDRGIPQGYRHMNGYGAHTFSFINEKNEKTWVKFHLKTEQSPKSFTQQEANSLAGENPDFAQQDLIESIENKNFPKWKLYIQTMNNEQAADYRWNPFDPTKVWYSKDFPLIEVGELELNELPEDYFSHVELATFSLSNIMNGIGFSPDKLLQGRVFSYADAQRNRVGIYSESLEVNRSLVPSQKQQFDYDAGQNINRTENEDDHYSQPGIFYTKVLSADARERLIQNIIDSMKNIEGENKSAIINRQLCYFFRANIELGMKIANGLEVNIDARMMNHGN